SKTETEANGVNKKRVQSHSRGLSVGNVRDKSHNQRSDNGGNYRREKNSAPFHSRLAQYRRIDGYNIRHREECRQPGDYLPAECSTVLFQLKKPLHKVHLPFYFTAYAGIPLLNF